MSLHGYDPAMIATSKDSQRQADASGGLGKGSRAQQPPSLGGCEGSTPRPAGGRAGGRAAAGAARRSALGTPDSGRALPFLTGLFLLTLHPCGSSRKRSSIPRSGADPRGGGGGGAERPGEEPAPGRARSSDRLRTALLQAAGRRRAGSHSFPELELCWGAGGNLSLVGSPGQTMQRPARCGCTVPWCHLPRTPAALPRGPSPKGQHTHQLDALGKGVVLPVLLRETLEYLSLSIPTPCRDKSGGLAGRRQVPSRGFSLR